MTKDTGSKLPVAREDRAIHRSLMAYATRRLNARPDISLSPATATTPPPTIASHGAYWTEAAWHALAESACPFHDARPHAAPGRAAAVFDTLIAHQTPAGHFLQPSPNDNLESWWYAELVLLHAVGTRAAVTNDAGAYRAAERAASYHLNETQPDHATSEPWAVFPFLLQPATQSLAEQLLHNASMAPPSATSLLLLADALYCLRLFIQRGTA